MLLCHLPHVRGRNLPESQPRQIWVPFWRLRYVGPLLPIFRRRPPDYTTVCDDLQHSPGGVPHRYQMPEHFPFNAVVRFASVAVFGIFMPETPIFLLGKGRIQEAEAALVKLRKKKPVEVQEEISEILSAVQETQGKGENIGQNEPCHSI